MQPGKPGFIAAADLVEKLEVPTQAGSRDGDIHPAGNPHIQLDPHNVAKVAQVVTQRLEQIDSGNAAYYEARGKDFQARWQQAMARWEKDAAGCAGMQSRCLPQEHRLICCTGWAWWKS